MAPRKAAAKTRQGQVEKAARQPRQPRQQQQQRQNQQQQQRATQRPAPQDNRETKPARKQRNRQGRGVEAARTESPKPFCRVCTDLSGGNGANAVIKATSGKKSFNSTVSELTRVLKDLSNTPKYLALLQELIVNLCRAVPSGKIKKLQNQLNEIYNDKLKLEKAAKKKKNRFSIQQMQQETSECQQQQQQQQQDLDELPSTSKGKGKGRLVTKQRKIVKPDSDDDDD